MVALSRRPAVPGDIFILLLPTPDLLPATYGWQNALQARYGGRCTQPLHISLQRFTCVDMAQLAAFLDDLQKATALLPPIPVEGCELQSLYSVFRQSTILKCRSVVNEQLHRLMETVLHQMQAHQLQPQFLEYSALITVLEEIERLPEEIPVTHTVFFHLFTGQQILISRIVAPGQYQTLQQWSLQQPR